MTALGSRIRPKAKSGRGNTEPLKRDVFHLAVYRGKLCRYDYLHGPIVLCKLNVCWWLDDYSDL